jgi:RNA polymerase I-specific transcription initiation factor RRN3
MLVEKFRLVKSGDWTVPDFPSVSRNAMRERLHLGLQYLLRIFPAAKPMLRNLLVSNYPYQDDPKSLHFAYIENLFRLQRYAPDMERDITELLTSQMVSLDVSMQLDFDNADDEITQSVLQHLEARPAFETVDDEMSDDSDLDSIHSDDSELDEDELQIITTKSNIRKLDITMNAMFKFYSPRFANPESAEARSTFDKLCTDFINIVLPTTRTRHSQYLLFHFAQMSPELTDRFLGTLFKISGDATTPLIVRCAAIAYIASYVARGARISAEEVQQVVQTMCYEMDRYRANHEALCNGPDLKRYSIYYEWAQGLMFVFCYRWRDLVASVPASVDPDVPASFLDKELQWMDGFQVVARRIVRSKFNPLKVCAPNIVEQYAKMARHLRLDYIYPILNANRSLHLSQVMPAAYHTGGALRESGYGADGPKWTHLEVNDQFDPYQLPDTQHWIEGDYITWQDIPGLNDPEAGQDVDHDDDSSVVEVSDEEDEEDDEFGNNEGMNDARHPRNGPTGAITSLAR